VAFVQQANIAAGPQQVNNGVPASTVDRGSSAEVARAGNSENEQITLLESSHGEWVDLGTQAAPSAADSNLEAVGEVDGAEDNHREGTGRLQRLQRRNAKRAA
jgi:hypothetical protein